MLRERWKQVAKERHNCDAYLVAVDRIVAAATMRDMVSEGSYLVVPERLEVDERYAEYGGEAAVPSFKESFQNEFLGKRKAPRLAQGIGCFGASPAGRPTQPAGETA